MRSQLTSGIAWLGISRILIQGYSLVLMIYIANILSPVDYALMGVAMIVIGLLDLVTEFGLGDALVQKNEVTYEDITNVFWLSILFGLLFSFTAYISSNYIEEYFNKIGVGNIIKALSVILIIKSIYIVPYKLLERKMHFKIKSIIDIISKTVSLSSAGIMAYIGFGVWSLVYSQIIYSITLCVGSYYALPIKPRMIKISKNIKNIIMFGINIIGLRITWYLKRNIDKIIGGKVLTVNEFGIYSFAFKLIKNIEDIVANVVNIISIPILSQVQNDCLELNRRYLKIVKYSALISFPIFFGMASIADLIFDALFSEKWAMSVGVFKVGCIVAVVKMMNSANDNMFVAIGKPHCALFLNVISALLFFISFIYGSKWGIEGLLTVWITVLPLIFVAVTAFTIWYREIGVSAYLNSLKSAVFGTVSMLIFVGVMKGPGFFGSGSFLQDNLFLSMFSLAFSGAGVYTFIIHISDKTILQEISIR